MKRFPVTSLLASAFIAASSAVAQSNTAPWPSSGNVGIGTTSPGNNKLKVQDTLNNPGHLESSNVEQLYSISSTDTDYIKALDIEKYWYNIPSSVTSNGYQIGLASQVFVSDTSFQGTIAQQYGIWSRTGINVAGATGPRTVNNAYGIYLEGLTGAGTVLNHYGLYQTGSGTKNYFGGNVGIGILHPTIALEVRRDHASDPVARLVNLQVTRSPVSLEFLGDYNGTGNPYQLGRVTAKTDGHSWTDSRITLQSVDDSGSYVDTLTAKDGRVGIATNSPGALLDVGGPSGAQYGTLSIKQSATGQKGIWLQAHENNNALALFHTGSAATITTDYTISGSHVPLLLQTTGGNVGIGTTNPPQKLSVNGTIRAKEVIVEASPWPDDVFEDGYKLKALSDVETFIEAEGHLPGVPNAAVVADQGVSVGQMQATLLRKIEELTLYVIAQKRITEAQGQRLAAVEAENAALRSELHQLKENIP